MLINTKTRMISIVIVTSQAQNSYKTIIRASKVLGTKNMSIIYKMTKLINKIKINFNQNKRI